MATVLHQRLSGFQPRASGMARNIEVIRLSAHLDGSDSATALNKARRAVLKWAAGRSGGALPAEAWEGEGFELLAGGRSCMGLRVRTDRLDLWSLRAEDPDKNVPGRIWSTEVVLGAGAGQVPQFSLRLLMNTAESSPMIEPHVPGLVLQLLKSPGLVRGGRRLSESPGLADSENDAEDLCDHLLDPDRRLPAVVVALGLGEEATPLIDDTLLARAIAGAGRVFRVSAEASWVLTRRLGKTRAVFARGVRLYLPGFTEVDDPFRHRLFLAGPLMQAPGAAACLSWLRSTIAESSMAQQRLGQDVLEFAALRTLSRRLQTEAIKIMPGTQPAQVSQVSADAAYINALEAELEEKKQDIDGYLREIEAAEARAETSEMEARALLARLRWMDNHHSTAEHELPSEELPSEWGGFADWIDTSFPDRIALTPAARRMLRQPSYENVNQVARMIRWLATEHYRLRLQGGQSLRDLPLEEGVRNSLCGGDEYGTTWRNRSHRVDWHIKSGGNARDPKRCLRIYYFWDEESQMTVIDHLPAHRETSAS